MESRNHDLISASIDWQERLTPNELILLEGKYVKKLKAEVDWANTHVFRSFKLNLVMDGDE